MPTQKKPKASGKKRKELVIRAKVSKDFKDKFLKFVEGSEEETESSLIRKAVVDFMRNHPLKLDDPGSQ